MAPERGLPWRRAGAFVLLGIAALVGVTTLRLWRDGRRSFDEAQRLDRAGEPLRAIPRYEDAARAYFPGSPYPARALRQLALMAKGQEMRGDTREAAATWEAVRRATLATRHFTQPNVARLVEAERELGRLRRPEPALGETAAGPTDRPRDPSPAASLFLFAGLLGWIGGALLLCVGPSATGAGPRTARRLVPWLICVGGLALWLVMAWIAG